MKIDLTEGEVMQLLTNRLHNLYCDIQSDSGVPLVDIENRLERTLTLVRALKAQPHDE
jgi:hypothetical protein